MASYLAWRGMPVGLAVGAQDHASLTGTLDCSAPAHMRVKEATEEVMRYGGLWLLVVKKAGQVKPTRSESS